MSSRSPLTSHAAIRLVRGAILGILWAVNAPLLEGQALEENVQELARQVAGLNAAIVELRSEISDSRIETRELRLELQRMRQQLAARDGNFPALTEARAQMIGGTAAVSEEQTTLPGSDGEPDVEERIALLEESQQLLTNRLEEQYQTKVESASRYRMRLSGIVLLNGFANRGAVDSQEVPNLAVRQAGLEARETFGLSALQSQLGFETYGPTLAGGRASAGLQLDFFGVSPDTRYASSWGGVRLRTAVARLDWARASVVVGQDAPFVSPRSPVSVASLAYPAFSHSGNLWTWIPQARVDYRLLSGGRSTILLQGGYLGPVLRGSPQPGYATRLAWSYGESDRPLTLGIGAYYGRQDRGLGRTRDGWAATADWLVPLGSRVELSGEFYRGRALGSLGAAQGRSVVLDGPESDPASSMVGLNVTGGWSQVAFRPFPAVELNAAHGEEHASGRDLGYGQPYYGLAISRNRSEMLNLIYRPRTDLLFSIEYRHLKTWRTDGDRDTAGHLNLGIGVLF